MKLVYYDHIKIVWRKLRPQPVQEGCIPFGKITAYPGWLYPSGKKGTAEMRGRLWELLAVPPRHLGESFRANSLGHTLVRRSWMGSGSEIRRPSRPRALGPSSGSLVIRYPEVIGGAKGWGRAKPAALAPVRAGFPSIAREPVIRDVLVSLPLPADRLQSTCQPYISMML